METKRTKSEKTLPYDNKNKGFTPTISFPKMETEWKHWKRTMKRKITKAKLITYLLVDSLTTRTCTKTNKELAEALDCTTQDVQWWINVLQIAKELHVWEEEGVRHISMFYSATPGD